MSATPMNLRVHQYTARGNRTGWEPSMLAIGLQGNGVYSDSVLFQDAQERPELSSIIRSLVQPDRGR